MSYISIESAYITMSCNNCNATITNTGLCLTCGTQVKRLDTLSLGIGAFSLLCFLIFAVVSSILINNFYFASQRENLLTILSYAAPLFFSSDAIIIAIKRRKSHKTTLGLALGILSTIIGFTLLIFHFFV